MSMYQILAVIFTIILAVYFFEIFSLFRDTKKGYPVFWQKIDSPDISSPNGQVVFLAFIFGRRGYPENFAKNLMQKCIRLRYYLVSGLLIFIMLLVAVNYS